MFLRSPPVQFQIYSLQSELGCLNSTGAPQLIWNLWSVSSWLEWSHSSPFWELKCHPAPEKPVWKGSIADGPEISMCFFSMLTCTPKRAARSPSTLWLAHDSKLPKSPSFTGLYTSRSMGLWVPVFVWVMLLYRGKQFGAEVAILFWEVYQVEKISKSACVHVSAMYVCVLVHAPVTAMCMIV